MVGIPIVGGRCDYTPDCDLRHILCGRKALLYQSRIDSRLYYYWVEMQDERETRLQTPGSEPIVDTGDMRKRGLTNLGLSAWLGAGIAD